MRMIAAVTMAVLLAVPAFAQEPPKPGPEHEMLKKRGDWMELGSADEQKPAKAGTVEEWGRSPENPIGGWYGLKKGLRGRFGMYLPPLMEALGLVELEHGAKNNRMRAK